MPQRDTPRPDPLESERPAARAGRVGRGAAAGGEVRAGPAAGGGREVRLAGWLEEAQAGRRDSLNRIVAELSPLLWQVARAQGLDRDVAEDVVQTTWLSLLRHLDGIRTSAALTGWLVTVTKREAWRVRRSRPGGRPSGRRAPP